MFVSTFYSYKGGVGRTFALVNVAVELAKSGRSVLLVDFDLEAPGLDTFDLLDNKSNVGGMVQFVADYIDQKSPPKVSDYVYEATMSSSEDLGVKGKIWVMPAGRRDSSYDRLLSQIHWQQLYSEMEGFFLFEDLKHQWESTYSPDYVLIDSRTGHTDVGGICTRQLADLVVLLFTPNEQNLKGLPPIVKAIRQESEKSADRTIETCFVASNVPTLDDEEGILRKLMNKFSRAFGEGKSKQRIITVQRYESLQLLNQDIFTLLRPKSRLAKQYKEICQFIIEQNIKDRQGVLEYLKHRVRNERIRHLSRGYSDGRLSLILTQYSSDAEVLLWVARCYEFQSSPNEAISLLKKAESATQIDKPVTKVAVHLELANAYLTNQQVQNARLHLESVTELDGLGVDEIRKLFELWHVADALPTEKLAECFKRADLSADCYGFLLSSFSERKSWQKFVADLLLGGDAAAVNEQPELLHILLFSLFGSRQFETLPEISAKLLKDDSQSVVNQFNAAMAEWAFNGKPSLDPFKRVIETVGEVDGKADANFFQCLAVAFAVLGDLGKASENLAVALEKNQQLPISKFSCWRYQEVSQAEFEQDLKEIESFVESGQPQPQFLRDS